MSVRFNGVKHNHTPVLAKIIFAALLAACSTAWSVGGQKQTNTSTAEGLVAEDQAKASTSDTEVTRQIRSDLMADPNLSTTAQNVQVITLGNTVTLKGVVASDSEKSKVTKIANRVAAGKQVVSEIEVQTE